MGSWLAPHGLIGFATRESLACSPLPQPGEADSNGDLLLKYERSSTGRAWSRTTGDSAARTIALLRTAGVGAHVVELHSLGSSSDVQAAMDDSDLVRFAVWEEDTSCTLQRLYLGSALGGGVDGQSFLDVRCVAGVMRGGAAEKEAAFISLALDIHLPSSSTSPPTLQGSYLVPLTSAKGIDAAREPVAELLRLQGDASPNGDLGGGISCIYPDWVGNGGTQCCPLRLIYDQQLSNCWIQLGRDILGCFGDALRNLGMIVAGCATGCGILAALPPPMSLKAFILCLLICSGVFAAGNTVLFVMCLADKALALAQCRANARIDYLRSLQDSGCWPPPDGFEP